MILNIKRIIGEGGGGWGRGGGREGGMGCQMLTDQKQKIKSLGMSHSKWSCRNKV